MRISIKGRIALCCFIFLFHSLFFLNADSIFIDLEIDCSDIREDLEKNSYSFQRLKRNLLNHLEVEFQENLAVKFANRNASNVLLNENERKYSDFVLAGTIYFDKNHPSPDSYRIQINTEDLNIFCADKILPPSLAFRTISSRNHPNWGISHRKRFRGEKGAVNVSIKHFVEEMERAGVFDFYWHPLFAKIGDVGEREPGISNQDQLEKIASLISEKIEKALNTTLKIQMPGNWSSLMDELKGIKQKLENLIKSTAPIQDKFKEMEKCINKLKYMNIASITIRVTTGNIPANIGDVFSAKIYPDDKEGCVQECIEAHKLKRLTNKDDLLQMSQETRYRETFDGLTGEFMQDNEGNNTIIMPKRDFMEIFAVDKDCKLNPGAIINSVTQKKKYSFPRILIEFEKKSN